MDVAMVLLLLIVDRKTNICTGDMRHLNLRIIQVLTYLPTYLLKLVDTRVSTYMHTHLVGRRQVLTKQIYVSRGLYLCFQNPLTRLSANSGQPISKVLLVFSYCWRFGRAYSLYMVKLFLSAKAKAKAKSKRGRRLTDMQVRKVVQMNQKVFFACVARHVAEGLYKTL